MLKVYNDCSHTIRTVEKWSYNLEDDPRERRSKSASTPEIIGKIEILHISLDCVSNILT